MAAVAGRSYRFISRPTDTAPSVGTIAPFPDRNKSRAQPARNQLRKNGQRWLTGFYSDLQSALRSHGECATGSVHCERAAPYCLVEPAALAVVARAIAILRL